jgi:hypothetical protein
MRRRRPDACLIRWIAAAAVALPAAAGLAVPGRALGAKLVGGREQTAIRDAFVAGGAHPRQSIVSIRASTVSPSWAVVKSVVPETAGRTSPHATAIRLLSSYYRRRGGHERSGRPPVAVRADLARDFQVAIVYSGSGAETIQYKQVSRSVCAGAGGFTDQQQSTVSPMSWRMRYVVDLDDLLAAVRSGQGTMLAPSISFDPAGSTLSATQSLTRTTIDAGCNGVPSTDRCKTTYGVAQSGGGAQLSFPFGSGVEIGVAMSPVSSGQCDPSDYTLGPSLWDSGATTALAAPLALLGGNLPADPYAPVAVSWPAGSAQQSDSFVTSPCQGDGAACRDTFHWNGTVALHAIPGG